MTITVGAKGTLIDDVECGAQEARSVTLADFLEEAMMKMMSQEKYEMELAIPHGGGVFGVAITLNWASVAESSRTIMGESH